MLLLLSLRLLEPLFLVLLGGLLPLFFALELGLALALLLFLLRLLVHHLPEKALLSDLLLSFLALDHFVDGRCGLRVLAGEVNEAL